MIKCRTEPTGGGVTGVALRGCRDMRGSFTACNRSIVTCRTGPDHLAMIDARGRPPLGCVMTSLADRRGDDMCQGFSSGRDAVVASHAICRDSRVAKSDTEPVDRCVASIAWRGGGNVRWAFATGGGAVMTT